MDGTMREKIARALCEAEGCDPDHLEPGSDPYHNNTSVIDGHNAKGEPCHLFWRRYDRIYVDAVLDAMRDVDNSILAEGYRAMFADEWDGTQAPMMGAGWDAMIDAAKAGA
jgi:hypothetical protein